MISKPSFHHVTVGISQDNPLSPLLGAVYLDGMDQAMEAYCKSRGLRYYRYMDDWLILCKTHHQLRDIVRIMNTHLNQVQQTKHPFKTFIGRIKDTGLDFLGYRIGDRAIKGLAVAWQTWEHHQARLQQLYEQHASQRAVAEYVRRWLIWLRSGVDIDVMRALKGQRGWDAITSQST